MDDRLKSDHCAKMLRALAAPERLRIVQYLAEGPRTVTEIAEMLLAPLGNVSHHLAVLRVAGLIKSCKHGRFIVYCLSPGLLEKKDHSEHLNLGCCRIEMPPKSEACTLHEEKEPLAEPISQ